MIFFHNLYKIDPLPSSPSPKKSLSENMISEIFANQMSKMLPISAEEFFLFLLSVFVIVPGT